MNQILMTKDKNGAKISLMGTAIKFFIVAAIVFALILVGEGSYNLYTSLSADKSYPIPTVTHEQVGSDIEISVKNDIGINKISYSWNDGEQIDVKGEGKKSISFDIAVPQGENNLNLFFVDVDGNKSKANPIPVAFTEALDTLKPKISIENNVGKLTITATDETELDYLTYQWEDEDEVKIETTEDENQAITQEINVQKGTKRLTLVAVDKAGNEEIVSKKIVGSNGPEIKVTLSKGYFVVKVTDEYRITKIQYTLNDEEFTVDDIPEDAKEYEFKVQLKDGVTNYLKINAYENDLMTEYKCKKTN